jgi:hypothetical protein
MVYLNFGFSSAVLSCSAALEAALEGQVRELASGMM